MMMTDLICAGLLGVTAVVALAGYVRVACDPFGTDRDQLPLLLGAFILAVGFIGLLAR
jgi:hypothetical protein